MSLIPKESLAALDHEYGIIRLIYHRNKNQHRVASWWKHLDSLKRYLTKLISLIYTYSRKAKEKIRQKVLKVARHLYLNICRSAFRAFNGIIALGQFITLGLTLVGVLGKVYHHVGTIEGLRETNSNRSKSIDVDYNNVDLGADLREELGEEVAYNEGEEEKKRKSVEPLDLSIRKKKKTTKDDQGNDKDKKKKKKKKKSAIDDIFG